MIPADNSKPVSAYMKCLKCGKPIHIRSKTEHSNLPCWNCGQVYNVRNNKGSLYITTPEGKVVPRSAITIEWWKR